MDKNNLWRLSASEIVKATTAGEIRTVDVITSSVDRMKQVNPSLNAVVVDLSEKAIETADLLDRSRDNGKSCGPLHGVPITIKINVDQKGFATSNGVSALKDLIAPDDAPIVKNLQKAREKVDNSWKDPGEIGGLDIFAGGVRGAAALPGGPQDPQKHPKATTKRKS